MKNKLFLFFLVATGFNVFSQISFEKGYFINNTGQKINCYIKNIDWKNNPTQFDYKLNENDKAITASINSVKEFEILNASKYIRALVKIDRSTSDLSELDNSRNPKFKEELLFLKVLIKGKFNLYKYEDGNLRRYFYKSNNSDLVPEQLIYKKFLTQKNAIGVNNQFKQQLLKNLTCDGISINTIKNVSYTERSLVDFFVRYNKCSNSLITNFEKKNNKHLFNLSIKAGYANSNLSLSLNRRVLKPLITKFDSKSSFRVGIEAEFILPFNKNKWGVFVEPTYQYFKSQGIRRQSTSSIFGDEVFIATIDYKSIDIPIGLRHYFFLNDTSKLFVNAAYVFSFNNKTKIDFDEIADLAVESGRNLFLGFGYNFSGKYSLEVRHNFRREILTNYINWSSDYNSTSIILGYTIL